MMSLAKIDTHPVTQGPAQDLPGPRNPRMENAAHQFEASLMQELFAPLQKDSLFAEEDGGDADGGSGAALGGFASEAMARAVSDRGGFGIARQLIEHFNRISTKGPS